MATPCVFVFETSGTNVTTQSNKEIPIGTFTFFSYLIPFMQLSAYRNVGILWPICYFFPFITHITVSPATIKNFMCQAQCFNQGEGFLASRYISYVFWGFPVVKVALVLVASLAQRLSGDINPRPNGKKDVVM